MKESGEPTYFYLLPQTNKIFTDYFNGKQSLVQLSKKYHLSIKTIRSKLKDHKVIIPEHTPSETVIIMDTTYFRRNFGVMVFRDNYGKRNLYWRYVNTEPIEHYKRGIEWLKLCGWKINGLVCDGRKGIFQAFKGVPIQMCHFHQQAIIRRYLTQNPRTEASRELRELSLQLKYMDKESWSFALGQWHKKW